MQQQLHSEEYPELRAVEKQPERHQIEMPHVKQEKAPKVIPLWLVWTLVMTEALLFGGAFIYNTIRNY